MATPVWAEVNPTRAESGSDVTFTTTNDLTQSAGSEVGETVVDGPQSVTLSVNMPTSYTVSIPKSISLTKTGANEINTFQYKVDNLDLAPNQVLSVEFGKAILQHGHGALITKTHQVTGFADKKCSTQKYSTDAGVRSTTTVTKTGGLKNADAIYAGDWAGTLEVTVSVTADKT